MAYHHRRDPGGRRDRNQRPAWNTPQTGRTSSRYPNWANTPKSHSRPPPKPKKPKGRPTFNPKTPASGKECRRMLKATAHRLSRLVRVPSGEIFRSEDPVELVIQRLGDRPSRDGTGLEHPRGMAMALARKMVRLRAWWAARDAKPQNG